MNWQPALLTWKRNGIAFDPSYEEILINGWYGFVYEIKHGDSGKAYIGRKYFQSRLGKRRSQSNWRTYWGSSDPLWHDICRLGTAQFTRTVLSIHQDKYSVNYAEVREMFLRDVLYATLPDGQRAYYNSVIFAGVYRAA